MKENKNSSIREKEDKEKTPQVAGTTSEGDVLNINELREKFGLKPIANGDALLKKMD